MAHHETLAQRVVDPVLEVVDATVRFPGVTALDEVSFTLLQGQIHALVGENGAGKSSLIKVLTGVYQPDGGEVRYGGQPVRFDDPAAAQRAGISTIYQEVNLVPLMSVARNIFLGREPKRLGLIDYREMNRQAAAVLDRYGIGLDVTAPLRSLGLGVQQMVAVARAVSLDARVVIMDEPTSSLEAKEVETLFRVIRLLHEQGVAVVYVSHRLDELFAICDEVTVLRDGRTVHTGRMGDLTKASLVAAMLGRDLAAAKQRQGTTHREIDETPPVLRVRGLQRTPVLHGIDLDVRPGEVVGLGGLLGAGRSETARAVMGVDPVDRGTVAVDGTEIRRGSPGAAVGAGLVLLPEDRRNEGIIPNLSIRDNIVLAALPRLSRAGVVSDRRADELVSTFMRRLGIRASGPHQKVRELSGGNQQKVMLARWLCLQPKVLILDEPTRGIDVGAKAEIRDLIDELAAQGLGLVLISSELDEVVEGSDRVVVLRDGRIADELAGDVVTEAALLQALAGRAIDLTEAAADG